MPRRLGKLLITTTLMIHLHSSSIDTQSTIESPITISARELYTSLTSGILPTDYEQLWYDVIACYSFNANQIYQLAVTVHQQISQYQSDIIQERTALETTYHGSPASQLPYAYGVLGGCTYLTAGIVVFIKRIIEASQPGYVLVDPQPDAVGYLTFPLQSLLQYYLTKKTLTNPYTLQYIEMATTGTQVLLSLAAVPYGVYRAIVIIRDIALHTTLVHREERIGAILAFVGAQLQATA